MKKILISMALILACTGTVYATSINGQYHGHDVVKVAYEGQEVKPDSVPGYIDGGSTMIPLGMMRSMGFIVDWNAKTLTANVTTKKPDSTPKTPLTMEQIKGLSNAVAFIYNLDGNDKRIAQGSGFLVNSHGLLLTAYHVAEVNGELHKLEVQVNGKSYFVPAGVYAFADKEKDIYAVYLQDSNPFPFFKLSEEMPAFGTNEFTISNPKGNVNVVTEGYVTASYRESDKTFISGKFETEPGSSGGPLLNQYGEVIGMIFGGGAEGSGITITRGIHDIIKLQGESFNK